MHPADQTAKVSVSISRADICEVRLAAHAGCVVAGQVTLP